MLKQTQVLMQVYNRKAHVHGTQTHTLIKQVYQVGHAMLA